MKREEIIRAARGTLRTKFHHQGRTPGVGLDCGGLAVYLWRDVFGLSDYDRRDYPHFPRRETVVKYLMECPVVKMKPVKDLKPGDFVVMGDFRAPVHMGVCTQVVNEQDLLVLHASGQARQVVEHRVPKSIVNAVFEFISVED